MTYERRERIQDHVPDELQRKLEGVDIATNSFKPVLAKILLERATGIRDNVLGGDNLTTPIGVASSIRYIESQQSLLNMLVAGHDSATAEDLASKRMRKSSDPYEVCTLELWVAMQEAKKGNFAAAHSAAVLSEEIAADIGSPWLGVNAQDVLGAINNDMGDIHGAEERFAKGLDLLDAAQASELYFPPGYEKETSYRLKRSVRYHLGGQLYSKDEERKVRQFCDEILTMSADPSRQGFLHWWLGQADFFHTQPIGNGKFKDVTKPAIRLKRAEECFVAAGEPVYAAMVTIDQAYLTDYHPLAIERAREYLEMVISDYEQIPSTALELEMEDALAQFREIRDKPQNIGLAPFRV